MQNGIPSVAIHDLVIQPEAKHLIVGTHGRSIYLTDISKLQEMTEEIWDENLHVFPLENIEFSKSWGEAWSEWSTPRTPGIDITFYTQKADVFKAKILTADAIVVSETEITADKGLNILSYDVAFTKIGRLNYLKKHKTELKKAKDGKTYLPKGTYTVELKGNGSSQNVTFKIE